MKNETVLIFLTFVILSVECRGGRSFGRSGGRRYTGSRSPSHTYPSSSGLSGTSHRAPSHSYPSSSGLSGSSNFNPNKNSWSSSSSYGRSSNYPVILPPDIFSSSLSSSLSQPSSLDFYKTGSSGNFWSPTTERQYDSVDDVFKDVFRDSKKLMHAAGMDAQYEMFKNKMGDLKHLFPEDDDKTSSTTTEHSPNNNTNETKSDFEKKLKNRESPIKVVNEISLSMLPANNTLTNTTNRITNQVTDSSIINSEVKKGDILYEQSTWKEINPPDLVDYSSTEKISKQSEDATTRPEDPEMPSKTTLKKMLKHPPWWSSLFIAV